jgi:hypothetical protein
MNAVGTYGGDLGAEVAALSIQNGQDERTTAHIERDNEEAAEAAADAAQVQAMHDEASSLRTQGWVDGAMAVGTAVLKAYCPAAGAAADGCTKVADGALSAAQKDHEAEATGSKAASDQAQTAVKDADETATSATSTINAALDFYRGYAAAESAAQQAALHRA